MFFFLPCFSPHHPHHQALTAAMELKGAAKAHIGLRRDVQFGKALSERRLRPWPALFAEFSG